MFNNSLSTTSVFYSAFRTLKSKKKYFFAILRCGGKNVFFWFLIFFSKTFRFLSKMSAVACELKMHDLQAEKNTKITNKEFPFFSQFYFWKRKKRLIHFHPSNQQYLLHQFHLVNEFCQIRKEKLTRLLLKIVFFIIF